MNEIVDRIMTNPSSGTASVSGQPLPSDGYWVGHGRQGFVFPAEALNRRAVESMVRHILDSGTVRYVGWWTYEGRLFIEPSTWHSNFNHAEVTAQERGEIAFYDIRMKQDVTVDHAA